MATSMCGVWVWGSVLVRLLSTYLHGCVFLSVCHHLPGHPFFLIFVYLFVCARSQLQHMVSYSLTRDVAPVPCIGSVKS